MILERGPIDEILMDNHTAFKSAAMKEILDRWNVKSYFWAAYKQNGNGILEWYYKMSKAIDDIDHILVQHITQDCTMTQCCKEWFSYLSRDTHSCTSDGEEV